VQVDSAENCVVQLPKTFTVHGGLRHISGIADFIWNTIKNTFV